MYFHVRSEKVKKTFGLDNVAQCPSCSVLHWLGTLLAVTSPEPAFHSQLCILSLRLTRQHFPELQDCIFSVLLSYYCSHVVILMAYTYKLC